MTARTYEVTYVDKQGSLHRNTLLAHDIRHAIISAHELLGPVRITRVVYAEDWQ
jgi:hypothetical protein